LFGGVVPRKASAHLRDFLTQTEALMATDISAQTAVYSPQTAAAKLALTDFLVTRGWQPFLDDKAQKKIADSFKRFADTHMSRSDVELNTICDLPLGDECRDNRICLTRGILSILLLAGAYHGVKAQAGMENRQGLRQANESRQR